MKHWYVVYTKPQQEMLANEHLMRQNFETCLPLMKENRRIKRKWQEVISPLFPRYLFLNLALEEDNVAPIRSTRGVIGLVRFGKIIIPLPEGFVDSLDFFAQEASHSSLPKRPLFTPGDFVKILEGPFLGCTGIYSAEKNDRALLLLDFLGRSHQVALDFDHIGPAT